MTPAQCRAARALINMSLAELSGAAAVPAALIWDNEAEIGTSRAADLDGLRKAVEAAGVVFVEEAGTGPGGEAEERAEVRCRPSYPRGLIPGRRLGSWSSRS
jgi:hypothetical protein